MTNQLQKLQDENIVLIFSVYYLNDCSMFLLRELHIYCLQHMHKRVYPTNYVVSLCQRGW